ncbi:glutathione S-transferase N-terminal domain-containing protein [Chitiniphilus purpureus]|uniref:Glutathione S-transferase N-terminal domain-containing protein n=1 Tax=Chitiniphilus purpureus TaxID=2981137 RepID=A0ABY6DMA4_9NEIS|nr:glutathione S-transferase C-terminal domain-containing protein [Chitiniphilus sp. CD1]UXY15504.1 glutathione S-transferase N-terminal domain-containing protein [Chitiniphilus sp. CD1]
MPHQLYIASGACSLGAHVVVRELGLPVQIVKVKTRVPESPIHAVNPLGRVPALRLDDGTVITENSAILPFLADLAPGTPLFAPAGSVERGLIQSWIGYFSAEVHAGGFRAVNRPERYSRDEAAFDGIRSQSRATLKQTVAHIDRHLAGQDWLVGGRFTIADAYLGVFVRWIARFGDAFSDLEALNGFRERYLARESVQAALAFEAQE